MMRQLFEKYKNRLYPFLAVGDQALQSLVNLLSNIFIIRFATKSDYGIYGVGFAVLILMIGVAHALVTLQMTVIAPDKPKQDRDNYFGSMLVVLYVIVGIAVSLALVVVATGQGWISEQYRTLLTIVALATPGVLTMEFMRQYHYFFGWAHRVLIADLIFFLAYFGSLALLIYYNVENIHFWALGMNGAITLVIGLSMMVYSSRMHIKKAISLAKMSFREAWNSGAWAVLGTFVSQLQSQGYVYLLVVLKGAPAVAEMNAARLFLSPLMVMSNGFSRVMIPRMALLKADGKVDQAVRVAFKVLGLLLGLLVVYAVFVALFWDMFASFMEEKGYVNLWIPVMLWGLYYIGNAFANTPSELLKIYRKFRLLTLVGAATSVVVFLGSIPAIIYFGILGAITVMTIGEMGLAALLWTRFKQVRKTE